ncbi:MAG: 50S ribosomal protein L17 [Phaeodactylibacter sp.]|nr:50S ribosomal protein L17 [Phaeodactylibacter sp.]
MRHGKKFNHLGRKSAHRKALMRNLAAALIEHKRINTTLAKAKALRTYIEPLVTKSKDNTTHSRRVAFSYLQNKVAVKELFEVVGPKVGDRPGGYVRVIKTGFRRSDASEMAMIEFVDFNEIYTAGKSQGGGGRRRRRRGGRGGGAQTAATAAAAAATAATGEEEE